MTVFRNDAKTVKLLTSVPNKKRELKQDKMERFVRIWESANGCQEVVDAFSPGKSDQYVRGLATQLRKAGVRLKRMPPMPQFDIAALNAVVDKVAESKLTDELDKIKYGQGK